MADVKISALPASTTPLAGTEVLPIVQGGATKQVSIANVTAGRTISAAAIGVGTASPASLVDIYSPDQGYAGLSLQGYAGATKWYVNAGISGININPFSISTNATGTSPAVCVYASGGVSIGNTTDAGAGNLSVVGNVSAGDPSTLTAQGVRLASNGATLANTFGTNFNSFYYFGTNVGSITTNGIITLYNTTSDRRLKTNIVSITPAQSAKFIDGLLPRVYNRIGNSSPEAGFIADEFQKVAPDCVTGTPDEVDEEGNPVYQMLDASTPQIIAHLVAEIQSLRARLKTANIA
jgi:hypothetical protein